MVKEGSGCGGWGKYESSRIVVWVIGRRVVRGVKGTGWQAIMGSGKESGI
jgi:hypothetical protein